MSLASRQSSGPNWTDRWTGAEPSPEPTAAAAEPATDEPTAADDAGSVGYLGPAGTFTHLALLRDPELARRPHVPLSSGDRVLDAVAQGVVAEGIVPWENSAAGLVGGTVDTLVQLAGAGQGLTLRRDLALTVRLHLFGRPATDLATLTTVVSHPHALSQCRGWLSRHAPGALAVPVDSTAAGLSRVVADLSGRTAAVGAGAAGALVPGVVELAVDIDDVPGAETRFVVVGCGPAPRGRTGPGASPDRTGAPSARTLLACVPAHHGDGSLWDLLTPLADAGTRLLRFESRPAGTALGSHYLLVECTGDIVDAPLATMVRAWRTRGVGVTVLGVLPRSRPPRPGRIPGSRTPYDQARPAGSTGRLTTHPSSGRRGSD
ncbi:prephenate dehydratase [Parafrankia sp. FMc2]|uniref:prephenate dehydratase n=1 Tax=Parafrankia sp. FMc2 TaxID=3233196 RepID=UPI0034D43B49